MVMKRHDKKVLIDLDEFEEMLYREFYPKISHKNSARIIQSMKIMNKEKESNAATSDSKQNLFD